MTDWSIKSVYIESQFIPPEIFDLFNLNSNLILFYVNKVGCHNGIIVFLSYHYHTKKE